MHTKTFFLFVILFSSLNIQARQNHPFLASEGFNDRQRDNHRLRLVFYNAENLFDYFDDSTTLDDEFLPNRGRFWNKERYQTKQNHLAKTLLAIGGWEPPALIGLCEIENRNVLEGLTRFTQLKSVGYEFVHKNSPDRRGIDVALLYRPDKFKLIDYEHYSIRFPFDTASRTRDILHAVGILPNKDTLHYFVNHWPSKFGGEFETAPKRMFTAQLIRNKVDSLQKRYKKALIVIGGDLNDEPDAESIMKGLNIATDKSDLRGNELFNLMHDIRFQTGTHSFENHWTVLDQFIVSGNLMNNQSSTFIHQQLAVIFDVPWLLMEGATGAKRPFRTYQGPKYIGGFSDHLPIYLDLILSGQRMIR